MATTTNYGWETPDDTDLVKDGAAAIRTLGSSVDTTLKNLNPETTLGDIAYRSSTSNTNTRLGIGTSGQVLTVSSGVPAWVAPANKIVQIVYGSTSTGASSSSTTYADTNLTASITPTSASNDVYVFVNQNGVLKSSGNSQNGIYIRLMRGATELSEFVINGLFTNTALQLEGGSRSIIYKDSPATTSSTTYKTQFKNYNASAAVYVNDSSALSTIVLMEVAP